MSDFLSNFFGFLDLSIKKTVLAVSIISGLAMTVNLVYGTVDIKVIALILLISTIESIALFFAWSWQSNSIKDKSIGFVQASEETSKANIFQGQRAIRFIARFVAIAIPFVSFSVLLKPFDYLQIPFSNDTIILIAEFNNTSTDTDNSGVTDIIITQLENAAKPYSDIKVKALNKSITAQDGRKTALKEGKRRGASIVVWGWYTKEADEIPKSSWHFEVIKQLKEFPELGQEAQGITQYPELAQINSFTLYQYELAAKISYLSLFTVGLAQYIEGNYSDATILFYSALRQVDKPMKALSQSTVYFYLGNSCLFQKKYRIAVVNYTQAIERNPQDIQSYYNRGVVYLINFNINSAINNFNQVLQLPPVQFSDFNSHGLAYLARGLANAYMGEDFEKAITDFTQAAKIDKSLEIRAYSSRGILYIGKQEYDKAINDFSYLLDQRPIAEIFYERGNTYLYIGNYKKAIADFNSAIQLKHNFANAYNVRGAAFLLDGDCVYAVSDYYSMLRLKPSLSKYEWEVVVNGGIVYLLGVSKSPQIETQLNYCLNIKEKIEQAKLNSSPQERFIDL